MAKKKEIDNSTTNTNCIFYNIENFIIDNNKQKDNQTNEAQKKEIINYVSNTTNFSPEIVERVIDQIQEFFNNKLGK